MKKYIAGLLLFCICLPSALLAQGTAAVQIIGKNKGTVPAVQAGGYTLVDAKATAKKLGGSVELFSASKQLKISFPSLYAILTASQRQVVINAENAAHGLGLTPKTYQELLNVGVDVMTLGNHTFNKMDVTQIWQQENVLVRPLDYPENTAGKGFHILTIKNKRLCVAQILGKVFMNSKLELADPFQTIQSFIDNTSNTFTSIFRTNLIKILLNNNQ